MKKIYTLPFAILILLLGFGFADFRSTQDDKENAYIWAYKACDKSEKISAQDSANYAALANSLDPKWLRLSDAANELAGADALSKNKTSFSGASGNDAISVVLEIYTMSAQFSAECGLTFKVPKSE